MLKDSIFMFLSTIMRLLSNIGLFFIIGHFWDVTTFGKFMYPFSLSNLFVILVDYGFSLQLIQRISKDPLRVGYIVSSAIIGKICLTVALLILSFIGLFIRPHSFEFNSLFLLLLYSAIFGSFGMLFIFPLRAFNYFNIEAKSLVLTNVFTFCLISVLILLDGTPFVIALGFLLSRLFNLFISWKIYVKFFGQIEFSLLILKDSWISLIDNFPYAIHLIIGTLYFQIDTVIVHFYYGDNGVGQYQAVIRILMGALIPIDVITNVYLPRLSKVSDNHMLVVKSGSLMNRYLLLQGSIITIVLYTVADLVISLLYGNKFSSAENLLKISSILLFLRYYSSSHGTILTISFKQGIRAVSAVIALVLNTFLNFLFISKYGIPGALYAGIITALTLCIIYQYYTWRIYGNNLIDSRSLLLLSTVTVFLIANTLLNSNLILLKLIYLFITILFIVIFGLSRSEWKTISLKFQRLNLKS